MNLALPRAQGRNSGKYRADSAPVRRREIRRCPPSADFGWACFDGVRFATHFYSPLYPASFLPDRRPSTLRCIPPHFCPTGGHLLSAVSHLTSARQAARMVMQGEPGLACPNSSTTPPGGIRIFPIRAPGTGVAILRIGHAPQTSQGSAKAGVPQCPAPAPQGCCCGKPVFCDT